jgi:hypothetical protein
MESRDTRGITLAIDLGGTFTDAVLEAGGHMLPDLVFGCLHQIVPGPVPAEGTSCLWNLKLELVSREAAERDYGMVVSAAGDTDGKAGTRDLGR